MGSNDNLGSDGTRLYILVFGDRRNRRSLAYPGRSRPILLYWRLLMILLALASLRNDLRDTTSQTLVYLGLFELPIELIFLFGGFINPLLEGTL